MFRAILSTIAAVIVLGAIYLFYPVFVNTGQPLLILNMWNKNELPRNFRTTHDSLRQEEGASPSTLGFKELNASGSAQFSEKSLETILYNLPSKQVTIVDLRQESHGFINGIAVSWFGERDWTNKGKSLQEVIDNENSLLNEIANRYITFVYSSRKFPIPLWVEITKNESQLAASLGLGYKRIAVTDHMRPSDADVEAFITFITAIPRDTLWIHFHCAAGEGRTTTLMTMYDMMRNATKVDIKDIFLRQDLIGGINFLNEAEKDWRKPYMEERKEFLYQFYTYCKQNPTFQKPWSSWVAEQRKNNRKSTISNISSM